MHQAAGLQFERMMDELARWRAVPEHERSPAPAWWWGAAMAVRDAHEPMRRAWCNRLGLRDGSSFADGAHAVLALFGGQTSLPWVHDFPRMRDDADRDVPDLHPQPSDDSAFQP
ncbi:hypothetical protein JQ596_26035 [Bradyrhizobium manausense]|uniref:hypothetical protein n=1 Tax=Bradyrhizobium TaxID=374 RepID=UPI001BAD3FD8|nr:MULTISPECIES: hypothetical protein [Bradyrhizobium]MBR0829000.1 hypothetical protein [Bradyrhizobium manausense]UVO27996.1 hypothetical protein KUF59_36905 [Bradyrhizobium arachidis]